MPAFMIESMILGKTAADHGAYFSNAEETRKKVVDLYETFFVSRVSVCHGDILGHFQQLLDFLAARGIMGMTSSLTVPPKQVLLHVRGFLNGLAAEYGVEASLDELGGDPWDTPRFELIDAIVPFEFTLDSLATARHQRVVYAAMRKAVANLLAILRYDLDVAVFVGKEDLIELLAELLKKVHKAAQVLVRRISAATEAAAIYRAAGLEVTTEAVYQVFAAMADNNRQY